MENDVDRALCEADVLDTADSTRKSYDAAAELYHELFHDELAGKPYDRALLSRVASMLPEGARVLDAGCGPCSHIGRSLSGRNVSVVGLDISERCVVLARRDDPGTGVVCGDMARLPFADGSFEAVVSYYSILDTPKSRLQVLFDEMARVTAEGGLLLIAVKGGASDGYVDELLGIETRIWFTLFSEKEIRDHLEACDLRVEFLETRPPYESEIRNDRIYGIARKGRHAV